MRIRFADGRPDDNQITDMDEAKQVLTQLWPSAVFGDPEWGRRLVWRNDREANGDRGDGDSGANAVAEILDDTGE